jgi:alkane 1-monooxygenase
LKAAAHPSFFMRPPKLPFALVFLIPLSVVVGMILGGWGTFFTPVLVFGLIPFLDTFLGQNTANPTTAEEKALREEKSYRMLVWLTVPTTWGLTGLTTFLTGQGVFSFVEFVGVLLSTGISSGVMGITAAHELIHRVNNRVEPALGQIALASVLYMHWGLEHVVGHHRDVATPYDPATARRGESIYRFVPRSVVGGARKAWTFEVARERRAGNQSLLHNRVFWYLLLELVLVIVIVDRFGLRGVLFFVGQSAVAVGLLEVINFVEHYGLERKKLPNGTYERVQPTHSWNAPHRLTNYFLFNLQRHSDHHAQPGKRYQLLHHAATAPQLPAGYATMVLLALVPPLWRNVLDRRLARTE